MAASDVGVERRLGAEAAVADRQRPAADAVDHRIVTGAGIADALAAVRPRRQRLAMGPGEGQREREQETEGRPQDAR